MLPLLNRLPEAQDIHLALDSHLNKIVPPNPVHRLPRCVSHFLGYREKPKPDVGNVLIAASALVGTFVGLLSVAAAARFSPWIAEHHPPVLLASLGAAAVLEYNTMLSPLAQPRNSIVGHVFAAFIGVSFAQLMLLSESSSAAELSWLLAPLACAVASALMTLLNCVYPPGGATAILAVADPTVRALGWYLVLLVLLFSLLMLAAACLVNNVLRRYPLFWWSPAECGHVYRRRRRSRRASDVEKLSPSQQHEFTASEVSVVSDSTATTAGRAQRPQDHQQLTGAATEQSIMLSASGVLRVPPTVELAEHERMVLQGLLAKLQTATHASAITDKSWSAASPAVS